MVDKAQEIIDTMRRLISESKVLKKKHDELTAEFESLRQQLEKIKRNGLST
jgi:uncharacterized coiled-coil DUF342 family protein